MKLLNGDSAVILKDIPDCSVDLTVTSPPYDDLREYKGYSFDFETIAKELFRVTKPGGGRSMDRFGRNRERKRVGHIVQASTVLQGLRIQFE